LVERLLHIPIESPPDMASFSIDEGLSFGTIEELLQYYHHNNLSSSVPLPLKAPVGEPKIALRAGEEAEVDGYLVMALSPVHLFLCCCWRLSAILRPVFLVEDAIEIDGYTSGNGASLSESVVRSQQRDKNGVAVLDDSEADPYAPG
ncbi:hypothetical protein SARC_10557, partial [Sphaeroforma arctica JP610]